jgi:hypothetical protein
MRGLENANSGSDQVELRAVPTYASYRKENLPPASIAELERLAVSEAIFSMAAWRSSKLLDADMRT